LPSTTGAVAISVERTFEYFHAFLRNVSGHQPYFYRVVIAIS
jgi:hypothetical protein